jgi:hypothetical protein
LYLSVVDTALCFIGTMQLHTSLFWKQANMETQEGFYSTFYSESSSRVLCEYLKIKTCETIILPVVSYESEIWSLTLRQERRIES